MQFPIIFTKIDIYVHDCTIYQTGRCCTMDIQVLEYMNKEMREQVDMKIVYCGVLESSFLLPAEMLYALSFVKAILASPE